MRVLVTGGTGFVGRHLVRELLDEGHEVTVLYRRESKRERLSEEIRKEVRFVKGDIMEPESLQGVTRSMDWVFHTAGEVAWARFLREQMTRGHVKGTEHMIAEASRSDVSRFVLTSSAAAVGFSMSAQPAIESFPFNGYHLNIGYAIAKWEAEQQVLQATDDGRLPGVVVNPTVIVGESHPGFIRQVAQGQLNIAPDGGVNFVDVIDVAEGHLLAAAKGRLRERYILGGANLSLREAFQMVADQAGTGQRIRSIPRWAAFGAAAAGEVAARWKGKEAPLAWDLARLSGRDIYYDSGKAERELGYRWRPLEETIRNSIRCMREQGRL